MPEFSTGFIVPLVNQLLTYPIPTSELMLPGDWKMLLEEHAQDAAFDRILMPCFRHVVTSMRNLTRSVTLPIGKRTSASVDETLIYAFFVFVLSFPPEM